MSVENVIALIVLPLDKLEEVEASPEDLEAALELTQAEIAALEDRAASMTARKRRICLSWWSNRGATGTAGQPRSALAAPVRPAPSPRAYGPLRPAASATVLLRSETRAGNEIIDCVVKMGFLSGAEAVLALRVAGRP